MNHPFSRTYPVMYIHAETEKSSLNKPYGYWSCTVERDVENRRFMIGSVAVHHLSWPVFRHAKYYRQISQSTWGLGRECLIEDVISDRGPFQLSNSCLRCSKCLIAFLSILVSSSIGSRASKVCEVFLGAAQSREKIDVYRFIMKFHHLLHLYKF